MIEFSLFIICCFLRLETKPDIPLLTPPNDQTETPTTNKNWRLWGLGGRRLAFICLKSILGRWCGQRGAGCSSLAGPWALCSSVVSPLTSKRSAPGASCAHVQRHVGLPSGLLSKYWLGWDCLISRIRETYSDVAVDSRQLNLQNALKADCFSEVAEGIIWLFAVWGWAV